MAYAKRPYSKSAPRTYSKPEPAPFKAPSFAPSSLQQALIDALRSTKSNLIADAYAGSGKTTTIAFLVDAILKMGATHIVCAFNKSIATELQARGMNGRTFHSVGFGAVMNATKARNGGAPAQMDAKKVSSIVDRLYGDNAAGYAGAIERLVSLAKAHMLKPNASNDDILYLIDHFGVDWDDDHVSDANMCQMVRETLRANNDDTRVIDFDDQLYFCWLLNLSLQKYDYILVDESQDTNPLRRELVRRMMHSSSRIVAVGDARQAIYGFTGASHDSIDQIAEQFNAVRYPLSVSYRCPASVIKLAQTIVPEIQARDDAPEGTVATLPTFKRSDFLSTDLVLCRNTAPLVAVAYKMLASRIPCRIMGREIGASLTSLIKRLSRKQETLDTLIDRLNAWRSTEVERAMRQKKEAKAQSVNDKVDAIVAIIESMTPEDADGGIARLISIIDGMFSDARNGCTTLSTVHKAKGMEAPRVFILDRNLMPSKMASQPWQVQQEYNLLYVAYTRALDTLYFVSSDTLTD